MCAKRMKKMTLNSVGGFVWFYCGAEGETWGVIDDSLMNESSLLTALQDMEPEIWIQSECKLWLPSQRENGINGKFYSDTLAIFLSGGFLNYTKSTVDAIVLSLGEQVITLLVTC